MDLLLRPTHGFHGLSNISPSYTFLFSYSLASTSDSTTRDKSLSTRMSSPKDTSKPLSYSILLESYVEDQHMLSYTIKAFFFPFLILLKFKVLTFYISLLTYIMTENQYIRLVNFIRIGALKESFNKIEYLLYNYGMASHSYTLLKLVLNIMIISHFLGVTYHLLNLAEMYFGEDSSWL